MMLRVVPYCEYLFNPLYKGQNDFIPKQKMSATDPPLGGGDWTVAVRVTGVPVVGDVLLADKVIPVVLDAPTVNGTSAPSVTRPDESATNGTR